MSKACVSLVHKAADEIRTTFFFKLLRVNKINELVVTSNKINNFAGLVTSDLVPGVACGPPFAPRCDTLMSCSSTMQRTYK
jgi:hypothetical protein